MIRVLLTAILLVGLSFSQAALAQDKLINVATGPTGGTYYPVGAAMAKIWTDNVPNVKASAQSTGGTRNNIQLLGDGDAEAGFADGLSYDAFNGLRSYEGQAQTFLRTLAPLYPEVIHILVAKNSGIKTLKELKDKRISIGAVGGSVSVTTGILLKCVGLDIEKDIKAEYLGHADAVAGFGDRRIDAAVIVGAIGIASAVESTTMGLVDILPIPAETVGCVSKEVPYFSPFTIPADTYKGQSGPVSSFSSPNILAVHEKIDPDLVYLLTKALFDHKADLVAVTKTMEGMRAEDIKTVKIPLHPGAEKYYRELGLIK
ncbi:MAG: TAXI family TRAP transporter solute-binding subunit [Deltaproteobacteria bacterium]|jgi:TRAP transporter TAXI family solute receptor|nr:TAXI family TRAP transporter solute-binding subunit [Deltaproteobacteria bacterium]